MRNGDITIDGIVIKKSNIYSILNCCDFHTHIKNSELGFNPTQDVEGHRITVKELTEELEWYLTKPKINSPFVVFSKFLSTPTGKNVELIISNDDEWIIKKYSYLRVVLSDNGYEINLFNDPSILT